MSIGQVIINPLVIPSLPTEDTFPNPPGDTIPNPSENTVPDPPEDTVPNPPEGAPNPPENTLPNPPEETIPKTLNDALDHAHDDTLCNDADCVSILSAATDSSSIWIKDYCRICFSESEKDEFISPCKCTGTMQFVHQSCLNTWLNMSIKSNKKQCELCGFDYLFKSVPKPIHEWKPLELTASERHKLFCSLTFTLISLITVFSTTVALLAKLMFDVKSSERDVDLTFAIKAGVICFLFFGGLYLIGSQCSLYLSYLARWRDSNQVVFVSDIVQASAKQIQQTQNTLTTTKIRGSFRL